MEQQMHQLSLAFKLWSRPVYQVLFLAWSCLVHRPHTRLYPKKDTYKAIDVTPGSQVTLSFKKDIVEYTHPVLANGNEGNNI